MTKEPSPSELVEQNRMLALERRALREGWSITPEQKKEMVDSAMEIMRNSPKERNKLSAMRNLITMETQNMQKANEEVTASGDQIIHVHYSQDWFYHPTEEQIRELEEKSKTE